MGSAGPELLPGGLIFQAGKRGTGYLLSTALQGEETKAVYEGEVCGGAGSFGGDAFANGVIYVACVDGTQALSYDQSGGTFTPLWQGPSDAFGRLSSPRAWCGRLRPRRSKAGKAGSSTGWSRRRQTPLHDHPAEPGC